jgi:hypothetical protein
VVTTISPEAATALGPLASIPEDMEAKTASPTWILKTENLVYKSKRYLPVSCCIYNVRKAQEGRFLKFSKRECYDSKQGTQKMLLIGIYRECENWLAVE